MAKEKVMNVRLQQVVDEQGNETLRYKGAKGTVSFTPPNENNNNQAFVVPDGASAVVLVAIRFAYAGGAFAEMIRTFLQVIGERCHVLLLVQDKGYATYRTVYGYDTKAGKAYIDYYECKTFVDENLKYYTFNIPATVEDDRNIVPITFTEHSCLPESTTT